MSGAQTQRDRRPAPTLVRLRVEVLRGADAGASIEASHDAPISIGTAPSNTLVLTDPKVSRFHLELVRDERGVHVEDLGSLNGTWLHGASLLRGVVGPGAQLVVGDTTLVVRDGATTEQDELGLVLPIPGVVAVSARSRRVAQQIATVAPSSASVLLAGETGTGKEVAARALHELSPRRGKPFVVVDCGSMPPTLIASELFGHERGAFTGADRRRAGAFERANGGTVFLDEIGELPLSVQPALLGPLERRRFRRVGGDQEIDVDVRVIAATHRDLRASVNDGSFRADLFYRLAVAKITLAPLRERPEDIPELVRHFVRELTGRDELGPFDGPTLAALAAHRWSGNVRELRNVVESALAIGSVELEPDAPPASSAPPPVSSAPPPVVPSASTAEPAYEGELPSYRDARAAALDRFERAYGAALVARCGKNASEAARIAQMDRNYLVALLRKHGLR